MCTITSRRPLTYKQVASTGMESSSERQNVARLNDAETPLSCCYRCGLPAFERGSNTGAYCAWPERPAGMPLWPGRRGSLLCQVVQGRKWVLSVCSPRSTASSAVPSAWCHGGRKYLLKLAVQLLGFWHCVSLRDLISLRLSDVTYPTMNTNAYKLLIRLNMPYLFSFRAWDYDR